MNKELVAIKILHNSNNRIIFNLYAELFRLIGIYVGEGTIQDYSIDEANRDLEEFQLFLGIYEETIPDLKKFGNIGQQYVWIDSYNKVYKDISLGDAKLGSDTIKENVKQDLSRIFEGKNIEFYNFLISKNGILDIYLEQNVLKAACQLQFYRLKDKINKNAQEIFSEAAVQLESLTNNSQLDVYDKYRSYALLYCKQKTNLATFYQKDAVEKYNVERLKDQCGELINKFPTFSNLYVLMGMICEHTENTKINAMNAYRVAISIIGDKSYASHVYYWLGVLCENYSNNLPVAESFYKKSVELRPKYRNVYKVGSMLRSRKEFDGAISEFNKCLRLIEKQQDYVLDPLEIEYYYKTTALICMICVLELKDYLTGIDYGNRALDFYDKNLEHDKSGNFDYYYRDNSYSYREVSMKRIKTKKVSTALAIAYREIGNIQKSEEIFEKINTDI